MRIGIDARYLSHGLVGGVHTFIANLLPALVRSASQHEFFFYADTKRPFELLAIPRNVTLRLLPYSNPLSSIYRDFFLWRAMQRDHLDLAHFPANYGFAPRDTRAIITLHDAINILPLREIVRGHPKNPRTLAMMAYLHYCTLASLPHADLVFTVSEYAKREIARHSKLDAKKIVAIHHAPTPDLRRIQEQNVLEETRARLGLQRPFVLADALKNPGVLVRAWQLLPNHLREIYQIVFFLRIPNAPSVVQQAVKDGSARLIIQPERTDLIALYNLAHAFIFPSWVEGFGLPILEAMTCGAPVIASNRGAIPEVAGDAALLVDAEDAAGLARNIAQVLEEPREAERLRARGFERATQFSWDKTAKQVLEGYERAHNLPRIAAAQMRAVA